VTTYTATGASGTSSAFVNCQNSTTSTMKAVGGGVLGTDTTNNHMLIGSNPITGNNVLVTNGSTNANGWRATFATNQTTAYTVYVLCVP